MGNDDKTATNPPLKPKIFHVIINMLYLIMISNLLVFGFRSTCYEKAVKVTEKWHQYLRFRLEKKNVRKGN